jgi:tetratricopeptide (TPR) repeat protein
MKFLFVMPALFSLSLLSPVLAGQHGGGMPGKMPSAAQLDPQVKKLEIAAAKLEKQAKAKPNDAKLKLAVAEAYFKAGHASEYSKASLPPASRYRTALKHYRTALAYNPKHEKAKREKAQIEMIYRQMGRPVPG